LTVTRAIQQCQFELRATPLAVCDALRTTCSTALFLDGSGGFAEGWKVGPLVAIEPEVCIVHRPAENRSVSAALAALDRMLRRRRSSGGNAETGVAVVLAYDLLQERRKHTADAAAELIAIRVDRSLRFLGDGQALLTLRATPTAEAPTRLREELAHRLGRGSSSLPLAITANPRTSLPREAYVRAVEQIRRHIALGNIYQANLCQRFSAPYVGDELDLYRRLVERTPAPRSAFLQANGLALASVSPETFVRIDPPDRIETLPIKGTRPRGATPEDDRRAACNLLESSKDRAELLMIVDLERNDLGRVCRSGTVEAPELARLQSFAAVHHLVARVRGRLRNGTSAGTLLRAVFPGGSITGAPKLRAIQILGELEPARRGYFTGSLLWFGDDGHVDSSIMIRSVELASGRAHIGAGGGIVADSEPEAEWLESNLKARALTTALGFEPQEAR
jgi:anthranilate/para-aminobenzoate synthase component I